MRRQGVGGSRTVELDRIARAYDRREKLKLDRSERLFFNSGSLYLQQARERALLSVLRSAGVVSLAGKRIVEVGCGDGDALLDLVRYGADPHLMTGIELLEHRVARARDRLPAARIIQGDASGRDLVQDAGGPADFVFQLTVFTSILNEEMRRALATSMIGGLAEDGLIVWYDFTVDNPFNPDVRGVSVGEMRALFPGFDVRYQRCTLAPPIARAVPSHFGLPRYLLEALPGLRTHVAATLRRQA